MNATPTDKGAVDDGVAEIPKGKTMGLGSLIGYVQVPEEDKDNGNVKASTQPSDRVVATEKPSKGTDSNTAGKSTSNNIAGTSKPIKNSKPTSKTKKSSVQKQPSSKTIPKFNKNGHCSVCKSGNAIEESIVCNVCNTLFHAICRDKKCNVSSKSICTKTFLDQVRPVMAKYGANSGRWGNFMFVCAKCSDIVQNAKVTKSPISYTDSSVSCDISTSIQDSSDTEKSDSAIKMSDFGQNFNLLDDSHETKTVDISTMVDVPSMANVSTMTIHENIMANNEFMANDDIANDCMASYQKCVKINNDISSVQGDSSNLDTFKDVSENTEVEGTTDNQSLFAEIGGHIESLFSTMKENLLSDVDQLLTIKLGRPLSSLSSYSTMASPFTPEIPEGSQLIDPLVMESSEMDPPSDSNMETKSYAESLSVEIGNCSSATLDHSVASYISNAKEISKTSSIFPASLTVSEQSQCEEYVLVLKGEGANLTEVMKAVEIKFSNIPLTFLKLSENGKKVLIGFPSEDMKDHGKNILNGYIEVRENRLAVMEAKKMYPKLTVTNVPNYLTSHITKDRNKFSLPEYRDKIKECLEAKFLEKDLFISEQVQKENKMFSIVYVNVGKEYTTLAIKVSPIIRTHLMNKHSQWIYIGNTRCKVNDRFNVKQCFKCQRMGHISSECSESHPICMYCGASHNTHSCPEKKNTSAYRCTNCSRSRNPSHVASCNSHHAGSDLCPVMISEKKNLELRTEFSKNI